MSELRQKLLYLATASVMVLALTQSTSAQNSGTVGKEKVLPPPAASAAADRKASDAMSTSPISAPTDAHRKAAAAMEAPNPAQ
jgi:hypothetical protein